MIAFAISNSSATRTARRRALTILRFADLQRTTFEVGAVECLHRTRCIAVGHFDETEATRAAGIAIVDQCNLVDRAMRGEQRADSVFGGGKGKISNVKFSQLMYSGKNKARTR